MKRKVTNAEMKARLARRAERFERNAFMRPTRRKRRSNGTLGSKWGDPYRVNP